jgi:pimeloyl-ACP methyl ester carboxylesterase
LFRHERLSLETADNFDTIVAILSRRLRKFFAVQGVPEHLVLLGYSMGAPVGLQVLANGDRARESWAEKVRAFVSVGGVVFGSHAADDAMRPSAERHDSIAHRQISALRTLVEALRVPQGRPLLGGQGKLAAVWSNTRAWLAFGAQWAASVDELVAAGPKIRIPRLLRVGRKVDLRPALGVVGSLVTETFNLLSPFQYSSNVERLKRLVDGALSAVDGLSTKERLNWWREGTLPTAGIRYYAVAATMLNAPVKDGAIRIAGNEVAYNPFSVDHEFLRHAYQEFVAASQQRLNDSQVALARAQFWPQLAALLNPHYARRPVDAKLLGVLGVHHWGLTLREVNPAADGSVNPFPSVTLITNPKA